MLLSPGDTIFLFLQLESVVSNLLMVLSKILSVIVSSCDFSYNVSNRGEVAILLKGVVPLNELPVEVEGDVKAVFEGLVRGVRLEGDFERIGLAGVSAQKASNCSVT